jgi:hypothetical protein
MAGVGDGGNGAKVDTKGRAGAQAMGEKAGVGPLRGSRRKVE